MALGYIPIELIEQILCYLYPLEIVQCRQLCKYMRNLVDTSMEIQLIIELIRDGMMLNDDSYENQHQTTAAGSLIRQVKARREALGSLKAHLRRTLDLPQNGDFAFDICDGVWGIAHIRLGKRFHQIRYDFLGHIPHGPGEGTLVHDLDVPIDDFGFWLAGNLQILSEDRDDGAVRRIHFRTFWKNEPHPLARVPFLDIHQHQCEAWGIFSLRLCGDRVGIVITQSPTGYSFLGGVIVWDWVKGQMMLPYMCAEDAVFISRDHLLRLVRMDGSLAVAVTPLNTDERILLLRIPHPIKLFSAQFVTHTVYNSRSALGNNPPKASEGDRLPIFAPDSMVDIIVVRLVYVSWGPIIPQLVVISARQLINACRTHLHEIHEPRIETSASLTPITLNWDEWGPLMTRCLPCGMQASKRAIYGSRLLVRAYLDDRKLQCGPEQAIEVTSEGVRRRLILLDFNPRFFSCAATEEKTQVEEQLELLVTEISRHSPKDPIVTSVKSGLGYRATLMQHHDIYLNAYLDGDEFVGQKEDGFDICSFLPSAAD